MGHDEAEMITNMPMLFFSKYLTKLKNSKAKNGIAKIEQLEEVESRLSSYEKLKRQGSELLNLGKLADAALVFEAAFQEKPGAESHLNLGFALLELRRSDEAKGHFEQAALLGPNNFDAHLLRAMVAVAQADHDTALAAIQSAIDINPDSAVAINILYKLFAVRGEVEKIEDHVKQFGKPDKTPAEIHVAVASVFLGIPSDGELKQMLLAKAEKHLSDAIAKNPAGPDAFNTQGRLLLIQNEVALAIRSFEKAIAIDASFALSHYGLAIAYKIQGDKDLSATHAKSAVLADSKYIDAYKLLAEISTEKCDYQDAVAHYKKVIEIEPDTPDAFIMLGCVYAELEQTQLAIDATRQAVNLRKNSPEVYFALGNILSIHSLYSEAVDCYRHALQLRPEYFDVRNNLSSALLTMGKNEEALTMYQGIVQDNPSHLVGLQNIAFCLSFDAGCTPESYLASARQFGAGVSAKAKPYTSWVQKPLDDRPLKVGLVSGDLRIHPVGFFLESVLTYFDIEKTEIHAFSNRATLDELQASLKSRVSRWTSIAGIPDEAAAELIHDAELDLLIDLSGHTGQGRCALFAWCPAPVQAAWLGFWASTGVAEIDYILSDRHSVLPEHHHHFSEQVWYMADTRLCFTPPSAVYEMVPSPCPMVKRGHVTFGCFQSIRKLNKGVLAVWARIHKQLPNAHFRLQGGGFNDLKIRAELQERISKAGIPAHLVTLHISMPGSEYLKAHAEVDIILDTFPYPGGTTTCDALWMGVPTVTLAGNTMLSRQGVSLLTYAGLTDWVAQTEDEYVAIAIQKASDVKQLSLLRAALRQQVFESPLFNAPGFASSLEDTFRAMVLHKKPALAIVHPTASLV